MTSADGLNLTYLNHFQYGLVASEPGVFFSKIGDPTNSTLSPLAESIRAAQLIHHFATKAGLAIRLCVSGGIDSEVLLRSFLAASVPFSVVILRFHNNLNDFDIAQVIQFCGEKNISITFVDLDVLDFFESGKHLFYGEKYRCQSPQLAVHLWMLDQVQGFPVLAGNFIYPEFSGGEINFVGLPGDLHCAYFRYFEVNQRPGVPWFLIFTAELVQAFFRTPLIQQNRKKDGTRCLPYSYLAKCEVYQQAGFDVRPRENKMTGFEKVRIHYDKLSNSHYGVHFDQLFRKPLESINPLPTEFLQIVPTL